MNAPAVAFDCVPHVPDTDVVFKGKVLSVLPSGKPEYEPDTSRRLPDKRVTYKILESYKGMPGKSVTVLYYSRSASDSLPGGKNEIRWVYANWDAGKKELNDSSCGAIRHPDELTK